MSDFEKRLARLEQPFVKNNDGAFGQTIEEHGTRYLNAEGGRLGIFTEERRGDQPLTTSEWSAVASRQQAEMLSRTQLLGRSGEDNG